MLFSVYFHQFVHLHLYLVTFVSMYKYIITYTRATKSTFNDLITLVKNNFCRTHLRMWNMLCGCCRNLKFCLLSQTNVISKPKSTWHPRKGKGEKIFDIKICYNWHSNFCSRSNLSYPSLMLQWKNTVCIACTQKLRVLMNFTDFFFFLNKEIDYL